MYILRDKIREFIESNKNNPILFVGYNGEGNNYVDIPGDKVFIDIPIDTWLEQLMIELKKLVELLVLK